jgi:MFS family permease
MGERATAVGLVTLANLVGTALGMALTPILIERATIPAVQLGYGLVAAASAVLFVLLARERPATPPGPPGTEVRALILDGYKHAFSVGSFWFYLAVSFIGMGIFNGVTTWIEGIARPRGFTPTDAGTLGAVMLVGGIIGAVVIPPLSDRQHRRRRYLFLGIAGAIPGLLGLTFAANFPLMVLSAFVLGFFLVSTSPIGMQYAAEITFPTPEGTSNGLIQLFGQASVVFVYVMAALRTVNGAFTPALLLAVALLMISLLLISRLKEPAFPSASGAAPGGQSSGPTGAVNPPRPGGAV